MTKQELAKQDYINGMKQKGIAEKYDISVNTLKSWIKRYNWKDDKVAHLKTDVTSKGSGNPNPVKKFTKRNQVARKHGIYAKYFNQSHLDWVLSATRVQN